MAELRDEAIAGIERRLTAGCFGQGIITAVILTYVFTQAAVDGGAAELFNPGMFVRRYGLRGELSAQAIAFFADDNAQALAKGLMDRGIKLVSGGTDNHLMLVDLRGTELTGKELEARLDLANITANKNTVPREPRSPFVTSGVRLGTPACTTRGFNTEDMDKVAEAIAMVAESEANIDSAKAIVKELTDKYPLE